MCIGQLIKPSHLVCQLRHFTRQVRFLPFAEICRYLEDLVTVWQRIELGQGLQKIARELTAPRPKLEHGRRIKLGQYTGTLARQHATKDRRYFGRGNEVARLTKLGCAGAVVAKARRIQRQVHVLGETDQTARSRYGFSYVVGNANTVSRTFSIGCWQR